MGAQGLARGKKKSAREILSRGGSGFRRLTLAAWFEVNPEALTFVKTWHEMSMKGETQWTTLDVFAHLKNEHGYPFSEPNHLSTWCHKHLRKGRHGVK